jgi:hypothetical protein
MNTITVTSDQICIENCYKRYQLQAETALHNTNSQGHPKRIASLYVENSPKKIITVSFNSYNTPDRINITLRAFQTLPVKCIFFNS